MHDHAEQFLAPDSLAAQYADDGVVSRRLEISCLAAAGDVEEIIDELRGQCMRFAPYLRVAVEALCRGRMAVLALEEVEQREEIALLGVLAELQGVRRQLAAAGGGWRRLRAAAFSGVARDDGFPLGTASGPFSGRPGWCRAVRRVRVAVMTAPFRQGS